MYSIKFFLQNSGNEAIKLSFFSVYPFHGATQHNSNIWAQHLRIFPCSEKYIGGQPPHASCTFSLSFLNISGILGLCSVMFIQLISSSRGKGNPQMQLNNRKIDLKEVSLCLSVSLFFFVKAQVSIVCPWLRRKIISIQHSEKEHTV